MERVLASIERIAEVKPIPGADRIEHYRVQGWWVVDQKGKYKVGDCVIYLTIDTWCPHELAPFLSKGAEPRKYKGIQGERVRTIKLRGALSQGLLLDVNILKDFFNFELEDIAEGLDLTDIMNIIKWEAPISPHLRGKVKGNFPSQIPKTDQTRLQSLVKYIPRYYRENWTLEEKLDGTSATYFLTRNGEFIVCSRNVNLKETEGNTYWEVAKMNDIEAKMHANSLYGIAIRMEIIGEKIQGNLYKMPGQYGYVFDIFDANQQMYMKADDRRELVTLLELENVPVIETCFNLYKEYGNMTDTELLNKCLDQADGKSALNPQTYREGIVWKNLESPNTSFKVISNKYLLQYDM